VRAGNVYRLFLLERPTACDASKARGGGKGGGDDSATFIIKSRLLAFTPRRNGEIKDPRHYTVAHRATAQCSPLRSTLTRGREGEEEKDTRRGTPDKLLEIMTRRTSLLWMEVNVRVNGIIKS